MARYYLGEAFAKSGQRGGAIREWNAAVSHKREYEPAFLGAAWLVRYDDARARTY